jgi:hypothetical protein
VDHRQRSAGTGTADAIANEPSGQHLLPPIEVFLQEAMHGRSSSPRARCYCRVPAPHESQAGLSIRRSDDNVKVLANHHSLSPGPPKVSAASHWVYPWAISGRRKTGGESPHKNGLLRQAFRTSRTAMLKLNGFPPYLVGMLFSRRGHHTRTGSMREDFPAPPNLPLRLLSGATRMLAYLLCGGVYEDWFFPP